MLMIRVPDDEAEETLTEAINHSSVERGVIMRSNIGNDVHKHFNMLKERGYFCVGMILDESFNVEFLFQRHEKQTPKMKMVEVPTPKALKYKL